MTIHFEATDPRGKRIICSRDQWFSHILVSREQCGWNSEDDWESEIIKAIEKPMMIAQDRDFINRNVYYFIPGRNAYYLKVCVKFEKEYGEVITAFETNNVKRGEKVLWPI
jgi:hypothetical protein